MRLGPAAPGFSRSHLFTLRVWLEDVGAARGEGCDEARFEWRGRVEHIASGRVIYFRDWQALIAFVQQAASSGENLSGP